MVEEKVHGDSQCCDVNRELKLQKFAYVVVDISSPLGGCNNRGKVVVQEYNIARCLRDISSDLHGKSNIGLLEGRSIVSPVTSDGNYVSHVHKGCNEEKLVIGRGSCKDLELGNEAKVRRSNKECEC